MKKVYKSNDDKGFEIFLGEIEKRVPKIKSEIDKKSESILRGPTNSLKDYGVFYLCGEIDEDTTGEAIKYILEANLDIDCQLDFITLIINSSGGYVSDGFALIDIMLGSRIPVRTVGIGTIASMGLMIFLAGEQGTRMLTPNCTILSHQYSGGAWGKEHELVASQKGHKDLTDIIMRHYKRTTGLDDKKIREFLLPPQDVWLTSKEALKLGIADMVKDLKPTQRKGKK